MLYLLDQKYITYNRDLEISLYCYMVFDNYPIDSHVCYFKMNSFNYLEDKFRAAITMVLSQDVGSFPIIHDQKNLGNHSRGIR